MRPTPVRRQDTSLWIGPAATSDDPVRAVLALVVQIPAHSQTLPSMSYSPHAFGRFSPTGRLPPRVAVIPGDLVEVAVAGGTAPRLARVLPLGIGRQPVAVGPRVHLDVVGVVPPAVARHEARLPREQVAERDGVMPRHALDRAVRSNVRRRRVPRHALVQRLRRQMRGEQETARRTTGASAGWPEAKPAARVATSATSTTTG